MYDKHNPLVSIIIPYYEAAEWLGEAISSVTKQTYINYEVIIVDDGSRLYPLNRCFPDLAVKRIKVVTQKHGGPASARNAGITVALGEYIVPLDSDDILEPRFLEECIKVFDQNPNIAIAYTGFIFFGGLNAHSRFQNYDYYLLLHDNFILATAMFKKSAWQKVNGYSEEMLNGSEDWEFWIKLGAHGFYGKLIPQYLIRYRIKKGSRDYNAFFRKAEIISKMKDKHKALYNREKLNEIERRWTEHRRFSVRLHYFLKHFIINDIMPISWQRTVRNFYYLLKK